MSILFLEKLIKIAVFDRITRMDNDLAVYYGPIDQAESDQRGSEQALGSHETPSIDRTSSLFREPEADFLQGDAYPGRSTLERR